MDDLVRRLVGIIDLSSRRKKDVDLAPKKSLRKLLTKAHSKHKIEAKAKAAHQRRGLGPTQGTHSRKEEATDALSRNG